jgi:hypothetical protein
MFNPFSRPTADQFASVPVANDAMVSNTAAAALMQEQQRTGDWVNAINTPQQPMAPMANPMQQGMQPGMRRPAFGGPANSPMAQPNVAFSRRGRGFLR